MQYGYFDDENLEYVITRPDTPEPWANYLGSPEYGALISNNAGGYSFARSGADGRILRYLFNRFDQPGRYLYLRDNADGDFWSASWQPVGKALSEYRCECRHGMGYTKLTADYHGIRSEAVYYVPLDRTYEVWMLSVENLSPVRRELTLTGYAEFTSHGNYEQDQVNLQYSQYITRTVYAPGRIRQLIHGNLAGIREPEGREGITERFFALAGAEADSYCGDRAAFLGAYRGYGNPAGVETGNLGNTLNYNGNSCGAISAVLSLEPGERRTLAFLVGEKEDAESRELLCAYAEPETACSSSAASSTMVISACFRYIYSVV